MNGNEGCGRGVEIVQEHFFLQAQEEVVLFMLANLKRSEVAMRTGHNIHQDNSYMEYNTKSQDQWVPCAHIITFLHVFQFNTHSDVSSIDW